VKAEVRVIYIVKNPELINRTLAALASTSHTVCLKI